MTHLHNLLFFHLRLVDIKITFELKGINLQTVRSRELPDCYSFYVTVCFYQQIQCMGVEIKLLSGGISGVFF